jgi:hypothetical protein
MSVQKNVIVAANSSSLELIVEELHGVPGSNALALSCCCCCCCCTLCCSTSRDNSVSAGK